MDSKVAIIDVAVDALESRTPTPRPRQWEWAPIPGSDAFRRVSQSPKWFHRGDATSGAEHRSDTGLPGAGHRVGVGEVVDQLLVETAVLDTSQSRDGGRGSTRAPRRLAGEVGFYVRVHSW
ncbi:hypothetical protein SIM91_00145 [Rhodococcus opacus]|uniref:hypothetical protein n=1 Tax=Rhodococcus opacus TaxID=37919 RepID=UPI0029C2F2B8|nr:hypothetical protein [Rhodococcus opacus]MDX5961781.1 hypothetical protein [Rhodococcus opacus]